MEKAPVDFRFMSCETLFLNTCKASYILNQDYAAHMRRFAEAYNAATGHNFAVLSDNGLFGHSRWRFLECHEVALGWARDGDLS